MKIKKLNESLNEALQFGDPLEPGRGACCPTAWECKDWIQDAVSHIDDPRFEKPATKTLEYCAKNLIDSKQSFENFNNYWNERFPAMIDYLDSQLSMIPSHIIAGLTSVEEGLSDRIRKNDLEGEDGSYWASEDNIDIDIQDREEHTHEFGTTTNQWGRSFVGNKLNKHPKVASKTWGRIWKDGQLDKSFEGPKYQVRAQMAKHLDEDMNEQVIIGFGADGSRKYYNNDTKEWMDTPEEATIFSDGDTARDVWFGLDKKPFKRVFVACYGDGV